MWPKMFFEMLPHFARLVPMADKFLSTRSASEKAQEAALAAFADDMRGDLACTTDSQAALRRQMQEHVAHLGEVALDVTRTRMAVEGVESRIAKLEAAIAATDARSASAAKLLAAVLVLLVVAIALLAVLVVHVLR